MSELERNALVADMNKDILLRKLQKSIYFEKTVAASSAADYTGFISMVCYSSSSSLN